MQQKIGLQQGEAATEIDPGVTQIDAGSVEQKKTVASGNDLPTMREFAPTGDWFVIKAQEQGAPFWAKVFVYLPKKEIREQRREPLLYGFQIEPPSEQWQRDNQDKIEELTNKQVRTATRAGTPDPDHSHQVQTG